MLMHSHVLFKLHLTWSLLTMSGEDDPVIEAWQLHVVIMCAAPYLALVDFEL
jgi:hypothetical protein